MLYLYHAGPSVAAIKARLALNEKRLRWDGKLLNLQRGDQFEPEYRKLNPNAVVPTLVHDGRTIIESTIIIEYLDEAFPSPALMSADPYQRATTRNWMKKIDDYLHGDCATLTFAIAFRRMLLKKTPEELETRFSAIPNPAMRERQRQSVLHGIDAAHATTALRNYDKFIGEMEEWLARSAYLGGDSYSLADAAATPYINRAAMLAMEGLWVGRRSNVTKWFERMHQRSSFAEAITKFVTDADREHFDIPREETWQKVRGVLSIN